ncbi:MAG TPA: NADP-dependent oxidoreductase [Solirubrobacterales bacterium]|jgi:NADPH:quinone reductase-like Zn-dependent oxidoreductase|nr:NADP-dependent oxidoreductase [Solirubrobacterales bacterium]
MRGVIQHRLGPPEVLVVEELPAPEPIPTEVQVRVRAAGVNPVDLKTRQRGGLLGDPPFRVGWDVSGVVTELGAGVTRFRVGDEVFGMPWFPREAGAYGEFVTAPSRHFATKPAVLSHEEAGALPLAGLTAWQIVVDTLNLQSGDDLLIHGAAGGVGHLAVQIAKARGATVIATARAEQSEWLRELGADRVIDYRGARFEEEVSELDAVIDLVGSYGEASLAAMRPGATLVAVPSGAAAELSEMAKQQSKRATGFLVEPDPCGLAGLCDLVESGELEVEVDRVFELAEAPAAHRAAEDHHGGGKIVIRVP